MKAMGNNSYTVTCIEVCPHCEGIGIVYNPVWARFHDDLKAKEATSGYICGQTLNELIDQWAHDNGYSCADNMGPEEYECDTCGGRGKRERQIPLIDALHDLGVEVRL